MSGSVTYSVQLEMNVLVKLHSTVSTPQALWRWTVDCGDVASVDVGGWT